MSVHLQDVHGFVTVVAASCFMTHYSASVPKELSKILFKITSLAATNNFITDESLYIFSY